MVMLKYVPCTRITGYGCRLGGLHPKSFVPGGEGPCGGSGSSAAGAGAAATEAATAVTTATVMPRLTRMGRSMHRAPHGLHHPSGGTKPRPAGLDPSST